MIGRLVLSDRNFYKIQSEKKYITARKCMILSESHNDILIKTSKEFNIKDEYVKINPLTNTIIEKIGEIGNIESDINIYYHLHTLDWMSKTKYLKLWDNMDLSYDLAKRDNNSFYSKLVITVDPEGSIDLDDGFSFLSVEDYYNLDIHIADPVSLFNQSNPTFNLIIKELLYRLQTCYIHTQTHLLPEKIVKYISLLENNTYPNHHPRAISFCFKINKKTLEIDFELKFTKLTNIKNYSYENYDYFLNSITNMKIKKDLVELSNILVKIMRVNLSPINIDSNISKKIIEVFMIFINWYGGNYIVSNNKFTNKIKPIIRVQSSKDFDENCNSSISDLSNWVKPLLSSSANYSFVSTNLETSYHYTLGINNYAHISSPMRRFIDMLNHINLYQIYFQINFNMEEIDLEQINNKIKLYKKISNSYELLKFITEKNTNIFKACLLDWKNIITNSITLTYNIYGIIVLHNSEYNFTKVINVEIPQISNLELKKYMEFDVELYYNSNQFKSNKFPFSIKVLT